jgi:hypothetical protein
MKNMFDVFKNVKRPNVLDEREQSPKMRVSSGYDVVNLLNDDVFFTGKSKTVRLSFKLLDIAQIGDDEIMKVLFFDRFIMRVMKFTDSLDRASSTFDVVDSEDNSIVLKTSREYVGGTEIAIQALKVELITQWEIPILTKLCRAFVLGDAEIIKKLVLHHHLVICKENESKLKYLFGLTQ